MKRPHTLCERDGCDVLGQDNAPMSSDHHDVVRHHAVGYDPDRGTYHLNHDGAEPASLSYTILRAVAAVTGEAPQDLDPLTDTVDPDALDKLFETERVKRGGADASLTIGYNGCRVTVFSDGHLVVVPPAE